MKTQYWLTNIAILIIVVAIGVIVTFKYIIPRTSNPVAITEIRKINLSDLSGNEIALEKLLADKGTTYCLVFNMTDCYSCIHRGLIDLMDLKAAGNNCIAIIIHNDIGEANGWSTTQKYSPVYVLRKTDFYNYIHTPKSPVMIKLLKEEVVSFYFIEP